jgi:phage shock protein PspC (stress-responsive transcriptional regulator)
VRTGWRRLNAGDDPGEAPRGSLPERGPDRYLGGVASGIAHSLDVDPFVVRVALAIGAVYFPVVIVFYALAWLLMRDERTHRSLMSGLSDPDGWRPVAGVAALGIGAAMLAPELGPNGDDGVKVGVVLFGLGLLLVTGRAQPQARAQEPPDDGPAGDEDAEAGGDDDADVVTTGPPPPAGPPLLAWPRWPQRPRGPRRAPAYLGWFGISALVVLAGILAAVDQAWEPVKPGIAVSLGLLLLGGVLLVSTWRGRARMLLPVGVLLVPLWLGFAVTDVPRYAGDGSRIYRIGADDPFPRELTRGYGNMEVDLTAVDFAEGNHRRLQLGLTGGQLKVRVPRDVHLRVRGDVGLGSVSIGDFGWVSEAGPVFPDGVDMQAGDPQELCETIVVYPEQKVLYPGDSGYPSEKAEYEGEPIYPEDFRYPPPAGGTTTTTIEYFDHRTGGTCRPSDPPANPAELELVLDVGVGDVEVTRV